MCTVSISGMTKNWLKHHKWPAGLIKASSDKLNVMTPCLIKNLKGNKRLNHSCLSMCVSVCVAESDEQSWPPWLPCSCTHCLQIRLGGVWGACGRRIVVWGLSWVGLADTHSHYDYHQFPAHVSIPALFPQHSPTNENLHIKIKIFSVFWTLAFAFLISFTQWCI